MSNTIEGQTQIFVVYKGERLLLERLANGEAWLKRFVPQYDKWATVKKFNERSARKLGV